MRILIAEDEEELLELLRISLEGDFVVDAVSDVRSAKAFLDSYHYGAAVFDRGFYGIDMTKELISYAKNKNQDCAVLLISAMSTVDDKVDGLELGADDYLEKPFDIKELKARITAASRRFQKESLRIGEITVEPQKKIVQKGGYPVTLSKNESALFFYLLSKRGETIGREEIMDAIYDDPSSITQNTVDELVSRLRKKLFFGIIKTVKTRGFCIE